MGIGSKIVAALLLFSVAPVAEGAGIFLPIEDAGAPGAATTSGMDRPVRDAAAPLLVRVAHAELARARDQVKDSGAGRLLFNLPAVHLRGAIERTAPTLGGYSLSGRIDGPRGGFVTLAVHDEAVAGSIWTPGGSYEILPRGGGLHVVREAVRHQCEGVVADGDALHSGRPPLPQGAGEVDDGLNTVVDVLVVWTPEREEQVGSEAQMRVVIDSWIAFANDAFERSGAFVALNLVGAERVDYVESDRSGTDLLRLANLSDGHMDEVHDWRDALRADLVSLLVTRGGNALSGDAMNVSGPSPWVFTHEIGHNLGVGHDRYHYVGINSYSFGRVIHGYECEATIMAFGEQCEQAGFAWDTIPYFASPLRYHSSGLPLGVWRFSGVRTVDGPADAVATINRHRHAVAALRR